MHLLQETGDRRQESGVCLNGEEPLSGHSELGPKASLRDRTMASIFLTLFLLSCSTPSGVPGSADPVGSETGGGVITTGTTGGGGDGGTGGGETGIGDSTGGSAGGSTGGSAPGSGSMSGPQASIPSPSLKKMLVANADSNNFTPVIGFEGAIEEAYRTEGYQVLVSDVPMVAEEDTDADAPGL